MYSRVDILDIYFGALCRFICVWLLVMVMRGGGDVGTCWGPASVAAQCPTVATKQQLGEEERKTPPKRIRAALCWLNIFN